MAEIYMFGHTGDTSDSIYAFSSSSAIGFGYTSSAWPDKIYKDATARFLCVTTGVGVNATKTKGLNCISWDGYDKFRYTSAGGSGQIGTESAIDAGGWDVGSPKAYQTMRVYFTHDNAVNATPAVVWISSGNSGTVEYTFSSVMIMEVSATGSQNWQQSKPTDKMHLTEYVNTDTAHSWYIGITVIPRSDAVGFNNDAYINYSITYS